ncbi:hypothetical protein AVEN_1829-1 [Araneus ventricosus]|uniref:Uncharacterized protein n=1 Tax=Araneus ventricosus TaxID=182803 RepID=A0A4Y2U0Q3_ARAVE|nr:hypothetical protein AVEN_1829-1 [Araneus ventricosus]
MSRVWNENHNTFLKNQSVIRLRQWQMHFERWSRATAMHGNAVCGNGNGWNVVPGNGQCMGVIVRWQSATYGMSSGGNGNG